MHTTTEITAHPGFHNIIISVFYNAFPSCKTTLFRNYNWIIYNKDVTFKRKLLRVNQCYPSISIDNDKVSTYYTNVNIRDQKDGISYGK